MSGVMNPGRRDVGLLSTVMKGLAIAKDIYGLKVSSEQLEALKADHERQAALDAETKQAKQDFAAGRLNKGQQIEMASKGFVPAQPDTPGAFSFIDKETGAPGWFGKAKGPAELAQVETVENGKPVIKFVEKKLGASFDKPAEQVGDYKRSQDTLSHTTELRTKYDNDPTTKKTAGVIDAYKAVAGAAKAENPTGATDIRLVYSFMKSMDPGSTVREGEYATAENSGGAWTKMGNIYNRVLSGERLAPEQRAAFAAEAEAMLKDQLATQAEVDARYTDLAKRYRVNPGDVVDPRFSGLSSGQKSQAISANQKPASLTPVNGKPKPGSTVQINGTRYRVAADGDTLEQIGATGSN